ncbi:diguanylate cyclase (GGDEF)-like protein [Sphingobium wenxiniae]|uniref:diguanylate cyclase n=1 Tax=Sphingobium wenxiniae (strain DSM 21828 / CGMCC 1.7748 / JZ-1) TaxID=595605 RepID=A0A562JRD1_SPHWJ|nr:diguanylate cyclase (GGDEF)-like protein [Sphingobium wenxiniae]
MRVNSQMPVGRLAEHLESLSRERTWFAIVAATAGIALADYIIPAVGFAPLYMPVICAAGWALGAREGYFVAVIAAFLAVAPSLHHIAALSVPLLALSIGVRVVTFLFIAAAIISFRRSYDRELFHAHRDRMTGTLNKEVFERRCARMIEDARHIGHTLLLIILDLDDFKAVNNREGHRAGDEVLQTFAGGAASIMRREDLIGRIGGDEFALLVRVPSIVEGQGFARDIHTRLSAVLAQSRYPVTCSMGGLLIPPHASGSASDLMHAADQAMYRAKNSGKNAIAIDRAGEAEAPAEARIAAKRQEGLV